MTRIGQRNTLKVLKHVSFGLYLDDGEGGEILLPEREVPRDCDVGDDLDVFVYYDSEDRLVATTSTPRAQVGEFAMLQVVAVEKVGAFLDWGLPKDLFLPYAEQSRNLRVGQKVLVYLYLDKSARISASMRLERNTDKTPGTYEPGQAVDLLIIGKTDLGFKAIIEGRHLGVIFANEVFQELQYGQQLRGFIKKVREDGKIDLSLQASGMAGTPELEEKILAALHEEGGYLEITDKAAAEFIHERFGVSKKKFKIALGGLYKKRLVSVDDDGIRLTDSSKKTGPRTR